MKFFAISDLHICSAGTKPMDIFGSRWENYLEKIFDDWNEKVSDDDVVLMMFRNVPSIPTLARALIMNGC